MKGGEVLYYFKGDTSNLDKTTNSVDSKLKSVASKVGSAFIKGTAVAGTALTALVGTSIKSYADIEQSIGGVETLFKDNADTVIKDANEAYKTAGLSANEYMETATSFSASLLQSLGGDTKKAASYAKQAIVDMSDNANKMGTDMSMIQSAYQGFAKQNYTMLDNLKLGYGGTKTEMERLLADASQLSGIQYDISSFSDITNAIHVIQESMDITGTTAKEASNTITGSVNSAKSAWSNFLSGSGSIDDVIETFTTAGTNISKALSEMAPKIVNGLVGLVNGLLPQIAPLIETLLPVVINGVVGLTEGAISVLPQILTMIAGLLPEIITSLLNGLIQIINSLAQMLPDLLPTIIDAILEIIPILIDNLPLFIQAGYQLITGLLEGIIKSVPSLLSHLPSIVSSILGHFLQLPSLLIKVGSNLVKGLWSGISSVTDWVLSKIKGFGSAILKGIKGIFGIKSPSTEFAYVGKMNAEGLIEGMDDMQGEVQQSFDGMFDLSPQLYGTSSNNYSPNVVVNVNSTYEQDPLGQMVKKVKTFSGGSRNDYIYGYGGASK